MASYWYSRKNRSNYRCGHINSSNSKCHAIGYRYDREIVRISGVVRKNRSKIVQIADGSYAVKGLGYGRNDRSVTAVAILVTGIVQLGGGGVAGYGRVQKKIVIGYKYPVGEFTGQMGVVGDGLFFFFFFFRGVLVDMY